MPAGILLALVLPFLVYSTASSGALRESKLLAQALGSSLALLGLAAAGAWGVRAVGTRRPGVPARAPRARRSPSPSPSRRRPRTPRVVDPLVLGAVLSPLALVAAGASRPGAARGRARGFRSSASRARSRASSRPPRGGSASSGCRCRRPEPRFFAAGLVGNPGRPRDGARRPLGPPLRHGLRTRCARRACARSPPPASPRASSGSSRRRPSRRPSRSGRERSRTSSSRRAGARPLSLALLVLGGAPRRLGRGAARDREGGPAPAGRRRGRDDAARHRHPRGRGDDPRAAAPRRRARARSRTPSSRRASRPRSASAAASCTGPTPRISTTRTASRSRSPPSAGSPRRPRPSPALLALAAGLLAHAPRARLGGEPDDGRPPRVPRRRRSSSPSADSLCGCPSPPGRSRSSLGLAWRRTSPGTSRGRAPAGLRARRLSAWPARVLLALALARGAAVSSQAEGEPLLRDAAAVPDEAGPVREELLGAARARLRRAVALRPREATALLALGSSPGSRGTSTRRRELYARSIALEERAETDLNLGRVERALGREDAVRGALPARRLDPAAPRRRAAGGRGPGRDRRGSRRRGRVAGPRRAGPRLPLPALSLRDGRFLTDLVSRPAEAGTALAPQTAGGKNFIVRRDEEVTRAREGPSSRGPPTRAGTRSSPARPPSGDRRSSRA